MQLHTVEASQSDGHDGENSRKLSWAIFVFCSLLSVYYLFSEKVAFSNGFGWDGSYYAHLVQSFDQDFSSRAINSYYFRRILPSLLVSIPARIFDLETTRNYIVYGFVIGNILCLYITSFLWVKICKKSGLTFNRSVISYIMLMGSYAAIKFPAYYPVLTDFFALANSVAMLYFYLHRRVFWLAVMTIIGFFIWPTAIIVGSFLLLFPVGSSLKVNVIFVKNSLKFFCLSTLFLISVMIYYFTMVERMEYMPWNQVNRTWLPLSSVLLLAYTYFCTKFVLQNLSAEISGWTLQGKPKFGEFLIWAFVFGGCFITLHSLAPLPGPAGTATIGLFIIGGVNRPLLFIVSHVTYYGATALFAIFGLKKLLREGMQVGFGVFLTICLCLALGVYPESRFIINGLPFIVLAIALSAPLDNMTPFKWSLLIFIQILSAKFWFAVGGNAADFDWDRLQYFPAQFYFLNHGPWMTNVPYLLQGGIVLVLAAVMFQVFFRENQR